MTGGCPRIDCATGQLLLRCSGSCIHAVVRWPQIGRKSRKFLSSIFLATGAILEQPRIPGARIRPSIEQEFHAVGIVLQGCRL